MKRPLEGVRVADFSRILAGPYCTMMLADAGADVVKIEHPEGDETRRWGPPFVKGESAYFLSINRNKRSAVIDLSTDQGRQMAHDLIRECDVVVENFLGPQREKLGISPETTTALNPRAIHCGIRGYDADSPDADEPGFDLLAQAFSGLMSITGEVDGEPMKVGVALADVLTAHWANGAILAALLERERTGKGSVVEVSLEGATAASLINVGQSYLMTGQDAKRYGNQHPSISPYRTFRTRDGWIAIGATSERQFELLRTEVLGSPESLSDPRFESNEKRVENRDLLDSLLEPLIVAETTAEWVARCRRAGVPVAPVSSVAEVLGADSAPVVSGRHPLCGEIRMVRNPIRKDGRYQETFEAPPLLGADEATFSRKDGDG